jgi:hypothetical protein
LNSLPVSESDDSYLFMFSVRLLFFFLFKIVVN